MSPNTIDEARRQSRREAAVKHGWCHKCWKHEARHKVNGVPLCCECYVAGGHEPAEWHPDCTAAYALRKTWQ